VKQLQALTTPFAARFIKKPAPGKHGDYVSHDVINQKALAIVGPHSFEVIELIYADFTHEGFPVKVVVGVLARLTVEIDGRQVSIVEVGDEEHPAQGNNASNAKKAASDAYKRCWMRLGLGLHLWSQEDYELPQMLAHYEKELG
jgi:hypothetical protein